MSAAVRSRYSVGWWAARGSAASASSTSGSVTSPALRRVSRKDIESPEGRVDLGALPELGAVERGPRRREILFGVGRRLDPGDGRAHRLEGEHVPEGRLRERLRLPAEEEREALRGLGPRAEHRLGPVRPDVPGDEGLFPALLPRERSE